MNDLTIGLDLGTTTCKAVALSASGVVGASACGYGSQAHGAQQSVEAVWQSACRVLREVAGTVDRQAIAALGVSGAMHSLVAVDEHDRPMASAMTWLDHRADATIESVRHLPEVGADALYERTGCPLLPLYHPVRLRWLKSRFPNAARFVAIKDAVMHRLIGRWVTDHALASTTGLLDLRRREWDAGTLELAGVSATALPELVPSEAIAGRVAADAAASTGLPVGLQVIGGASDGALANYGGVGLEGRAVVSIGTSAAVRRFVTEPVLDSNARVWCYLAVHGRYVVGCAMNNGGHVLARYAQPLAFDEVVAQIAPTADEVDSRGLVIVPFEMPERGTPFSPDVKPAPLGPIAQASPGARLRAVAEGVAMSVASALSLVEPQSNADEPVRLTGGWSRFPVLVQLVADVLQRPIEASPSSDDAVIGAAMLARDALRVAPPVRKAPAQRIEPDRTRSAAMMQRRELFERAGGFMFH